MSDLRLLTLGGVRVLLNQEDITTQLPTKAVGLMIYLARHRQPKSREHLAEMFWPERRPEQAYGSLRTALSKIRPLVADQLDAKHLEIGFNAWLDANQFEEALQNVDTLPDGLGLYHGDFMGGFFAGDARYFEHWQLREADKLHEQFILAVLQYVQILQINAQFDHAILVVRQALAHAPLREDLHRILIQLYHATGERATALRQYHICRSLLWEELGIEPSPATQALFQQIDHIPPITTTHIPHHKLPIRMTSFIGRSDALYQVEELLKTCNLMTITATGGTGKTRLALELAYRKHDDFKDGVVFVDLTKISHVEQALATIATTLKLYENSNQDIQTQINSYLQDREMLLILDNFEHIMGAAILLPDLISNAPHVKLLITSREPLKLYGEQLFQLAPLSLEESCQLFRERLRAIHPNFHRTESSDHQIETICTYLEGLPLAIELAVTRTRTLTLDEILEGLSSRFKLLVSDLRNVPRRQQALFNTIDWSYALLQPEQATLFRQLAVFRGGWTQDAINYISPYAEFLPDLIDKNLVRRSVLGLQRYTLLETMREYAHDQLEHHQEQEALSIRHAEWVCYFSEQMDAQLRTSQHAQAVQMIKNEHDNILVALDYLAKHHEQSLTHARIISALGWFWSSQQSHHIPFVRIQKLITQGDYLPDDLYAHLLVSGGHSAHGLGYYDLADTWQNQALSIFEKLNDSANIAYTKLFLSARIAPEINAQEILFELREYAHTQQDNFLLAIRTTSKKPNHFTRRTGSL